MRVEISNKFLFIVGTTLGVLNLFYPNLIIAFFCGACFGQIFLNLAAKKDR